MSRAIAALSAGTGGCMVSDVVESDPWGYCSPNRFLNVGVGVESPLSPESMLVWLHQIESALGSKGHRNTDGTYADRLVDIDVMAVDGQAVSLPMLRIPHPHLAERDFFLRPLAQLAPHWHDPLTGLTAAQMLDSLILAQTAH